ncbi:hypothetical protein MBLNU230_g0504t1 [Neophaeotheca triangularis]
MSEALDDEVTSINSIYGDETLVKTSSGSHSYALTLPSRPTVAVSIEFSPDYPDTPPSVTGTHHVGADIAKGEGAKIVDAVRGVLAEVYRPGEPCIFDLIEDTNQKLEQLGLDQSARDEGQQATEASGQEDPNIDFSNGYYIDPEDQALDSLTDPPPWIISEPISEKKSVFVARAAAVESVDQAKSYLAHLLNSDKKVAKATHNMTAWRIRGPNGVQFQDCDDDGETAAGGRMLHLLELMGVWDVMVVVTRWYGGVQLGPDRFRFINMCARDAVVKGGFVVEEEKKGKEGGKRKGKK